MKALIFERAGMKLEDMNDVGTGRIRTAFHTKDGKALFLELIAVRKNHRYHQDWCKWERTGFVDGCYEMEGCEINKDYVKQPINENLCHFEWTLSGILSLVNSLGGDFDTIGIITPKEFRVFKDGEGFRCNFGD